MISEVFTDIIRNIGRKRRGQDVIASVWENRQFLYGGECFTLYQLSVNATYLI